MLNQFLHNEPSRLNQVNSIDNLSVLEQYSVFTKESVYLVQFVKSVPCEATQYGLGKRTPLIMENIDNGFKGLAKVIFTQ